MRTGDLQLINDLVDIAPTLRPLLEEHLEDNYNQILPHLFLAAVLRFAIDNPTDRAIATVLGYLEQAFESGDAERQELIATGFLENLPPRGEVGWELRSRLGPALRAEAARVS